MMAEDKPIAERVGAKASDNEPPRVKRPRPQKELKQREAR